SLVCATQVPVALLPFPDPAQSVGLDLGLGDAVVPSTGPRIPAPPLLSAWCTQAAPCPAHLQPQTEGQSEQGQGTSDSGACPSACGWPAGQLPSRGEYKAH